MQGAPHFRLLLVYCRLPDIVRHSCPSSNTQSKSLLDAHLIYRGTASTLDQVIVGRMVAGLGGAGMVSMLSVFIAGQYASVDSNREVA